MAYSHALGQTVINGKVMDAQSNEALVGVSVKAIGSTAGTSTDEKGNYSLTVPLNTKELEFRFLGYQTQAIAINGRQTIPVLLHPDDAKLDEVVVVGYGTVKKSDLTGSVTTLSSKDFNKGAITSADQLIAGKAAGVQVVQNSGEPGGGISVNIRGVGSINAGNSPLYVIDGLPLDNSAAVTGSGTSFTGMRTVRNPLNSINPNDIASIEVLKDASATAIYGSRGANGVVLITTKSGSSGALRVQYDAYAGMQNVAHKIELLNAPDYMRVMNAIIDAGGGNESQKITDISGTGTNWLDEIYHQQAAIQNHNLSFSGGNEHTTFLASLNYYDQDGILLHSNNKRYTGRINLEHHADRFKLGLSLSTSYSKDLYVPNGMDLNERAGIVYAAINYDPTLSIWDDNGKYTLSKDMNIDNPLAIANGKQARSNLYRTFGTIYGEYQLAEGLSAKLNVGGDVVNQRRDTYVNRLTIDGNAAGGIASILQGKNSNYLVEGTINYHRDFKQSSLNAVIGMTGQRFIDNDFSAEARGFPADVTKTDNLGLGDPTTHITSSGKSSNSLLSYLGRVNYTLLNKYLFTTALRVDGSSRFGTNNKYGYFPSVALGWKLNEEDFLKNVKSLSNLKLRTSWGQTGNQEIGNYQSMSTFGTGLKYVYDGVQVTSTTPSRLANLNLKWETSEQLNLGLDFGILQNRVSGTIDWYTKNTKDMLLNLPVPRSTGFSTIMTNIGGVRNSGFEFMLTTNNLTGAFKWDSNISLNTLKNKVTNLGGIENIITGSAGSTSQIAIIEEGKPLNSFYGYKIAGIWQQNDDFSVTDDQVSPGDIKYVDTNGDRVVNAEDRVLLGSSFPSFMWSFTNTFSYKNFGLYVFIEGVNGAKMLNNNLVDTYFPANLKRNRLAEPLLNRWTPENPSSIYPSFVNPNGQGQKTVNSYTVEDASYIRLNTIRLSYQLPLKTSTIKALSLYVSGQNLVTITDYTGYDPALNPNGSANFRIDWNAYPSARTFLIGVNLGL
ncbi:TonB-dependent receptor [Olivibacter ginsenosidimutans]|uniref:TonB-dependent receptor n=2 Tax=Olivibacter ginsenosidimutans TaxID=1176537 RepID=A0ABP9AIV3_9SPHI